MPRFDLRFMFSRNANDGLASLLKSLIPAAAAILMALPVEDAQAAGTGDDGQVIVERAPVSTGKETQVTDAGDHRFFAGWRSDPFFFDTMGALNNLQFTGADFFAVKDVCSIVLEVPNSALVPKKMGLWHRTLDGASGKRAGCPRLTELSNIRPPFVHPV